MKTITPDDSRETGAPPGDGSRHSVVRSGPGGSRSEGSRVLAALRLWLGGLRIGLSSIRREPLLGMKRLVLPVSYWRTAEFAYAWQQLPSGSGRLVFDLGSPKDLATMAVRDRGFDVIASDILPESVQVCQRYSIAQGLVRPHGPSVLTLVSDGRRLPLSDDGVDAAFSISVLEHIPDDGDSTAIRELVRITRPGGLIIVTVPFALRYREGFVDHDVYERQRVGTDPVFFERHYDSDTLRSRLIEPSGAELVDLELWGETRVRVEKMMNRFGSTTRALLSPAEPLLSLMFLRRMKGETSGHPMAAFLTLRKRSRPA